MANGTRRVRRKRIAVKNSGPGHRRTRHEGKARKQRDRGYAQARLLKRSPILDLSITEDVSEDRRVSGLPQPVAPNVLANTDLEIGPARPHPSSSKSIACRASWARRRREGKPLSNKSPYGLQLSNEKDVEEPITAPYVRLAFEWYACGIQIPTIAQRLSREAPAHTVATYKASRRNAMRRTRTTLPRWIGKNGKCNRTRLLLQQPRYRGTIVSTALFDLVQEGLRLQPFKRKPVRQYPYPLSGSVLCERCNGSLHGHTTGYDKPQTLYRKQHHLSDNLVGIPSFTRYYSCKPCGTLISAATLEHRFFQHLATLVIPPKYWYPWASATVGSIVNTRAALVQHLQAFKRKHLALASMPTHALFSRCIPELFRTAPPEQSQRFAAALIRLFTGYPTVGSAGVFNWPDPPEDVSIIQAAVLLDIAAHRAVRVLARLEDQIADQSIDDLQMEATESARSTLSAFRRTNSHRWRQRPTNMDVPVVVDSEDRCGCGDMNCGYFTPPPSYIINDAS